MIKILTAQQIRKLDGYTIQHEPVASIDLMERACRAFCSWFTDKVDPTRRIGIVCGTGNNGGDGLGIARMLHAWDYSVSVWIIKGGVPESPDFITNRSRLPDTISVTTIEEVIDQNTFANCDILIDAIFGSGLSRPPEGIYAEVIEKINAAEVTRIAVDIPSGLMADKPSAGAIVKAHYTVSFQLPKLAFFFPSSDVYVGKWSTVDIGLSKEGIELTETIQYLLTRKYIKCLIKPLNKFDHKGNRGSALVVAGSYGKMGAAVLAARGALRTGIGLLTVHIPISGYGIIQTSVPEAMVSMDEAEKFFTSVPDLKAYDAIGIGPGIGQDKQTVKALGDLLERSACPVVLDADALNCMGAHRELLHVIPKGSILTPHPKEFERLAGESRNDFERLERQQEFSKANAVVVVLKGAYTSITSPQGNVYFNNTGNPGMATGGTGDVLTGVLTALLAQGYDSLECAQLGVWLHGLAGDVAGRKSGMRGIIASDITDHLPDAYRQLC